MKTERNILIAFLLNISFSIFELIGGIFTTLGVITPSLIIISLLATVLQALAGNSIVENAFAGISVAVSALIVQAVIKMTKSGIKDIFTAVVAVCSFVLTFVLGLSPVISVLLAGVSAVIFKAVTEKGGKE